MSREEKGHETINGVEEENEQQIIDTELTNKVDNPGKGDTDKSLKENEANPAKRNDYDDVDGDDDDKRQTNGISDKIVYSSSRNDKSLNMPYAHERLTRDRAKKSKVKNALTHLIPGYTAPMALNSSSLDKFRPAGGIRELQWRAARTDASTKDFVLEATTKHTQAMVLNASDRRGCLPKSYTAAYASFKRGTKHPPDRTAGKGWFGMTPTTMTEQVKTDLAVIRNRTYLDPKRFYKSADKQHKIIQVGTVVEGPSEYFSSRLTKKQRRSNITEEIMADPTSSNYAKDKYKQMSQEKNRQAKLRKFKRNKRVKKIY
jgi:hypothetical protein